MRFSICERQVFSQTRVACEVKKRTRDGRLCVSWSWCAERPKPASELAAQLAAQLAAPPAAQQCPAFVGNGSHRAASFSSQSKEELDRCPLTVVKHRKPIL